MAKILTLDIGATKVTVAEYALKGKRELTLVAYATAPIEGLDLEMEGSAGAVLTPAIQQAMSEAGIRPGPANLALGGQMIFPRFAKLPPVDAAKLGELLRYEVEQNVPFPIDEVVYDSQVTGETAEGDTAALVVAAKSVHVNAVLEAVQAAGLTPVVVDAAPTALCNALAASGADTSGCSIVLDIGAKTTSLAIVEDEKIYLRSIPVAGNAITRDIANAFGCTPEEAEGLKRECAYVSLGGVTEDENETADRVSKIVRAALTRLHAEISRSINFYRSQQGGGVPSRMFLTGGSAVMPQIDDFFREALQIEVNFLNPFEAIALGSKISEEQLGTDAFVLAESAGLALRATDVAQFEINLLPPELVAQAKNRRRVPFVAVGAAFLVAATGILAYAQTCAREVTVAESEAVAGAAAKVRTKESALKKELAAFEAERARCDAFAKTLAARSETLTRLGAVRRSLLPGMWITAWETSPEGAAPGTVRVTLRGWVDNLRALEKKYAEENGGKHLTAAEIVKAALAAQPALAGGSVKIFAQKDVGGRGCLGEGAIDLVFAPPPSMAGDAADAGKKKTGKKKGKGTK